MQTYFDVDDTIMKQLQKYNIEANIKAKKRFDI